jgi:hypothetical protein
MPRVTEETKQALLDAMLEAAETAKRLTTDAANQEDALDEVLLAALHSRPLWWYPKYKSETPTRPGWLGFAERRKRFAKAMRDLAIFTALVALALPEAVDRWMFLGFSVTIALAWAWQLDVAIREIAVLTGLAPLTQAHESAE